MLCKRRLRSLREMWGETSAHEICYDKDQRPKQRSSLFGLSIFRKCRCWSSSSFCSTAARGLDYRRCFPNYQELNSEKQVNHSSSSTIAYGKIGFGGIHFEMDFQEYWWDWMASWHQVCSDQRRRSRHKCGDWRRSNQARTRAHLHSANHLPSQTRSL